MNAADLRYTRATGVRSEHPDEQGGQQSKENGPHHIQEISDNIRPCSRSTPSKDLRPGFPLEDNVNYLSIQG